MVRLQGSATTLCSALLVVLCLCAVLLSAQSPPVQSAVLSGLITDPSGAVIADAAVTLQSEQGPDLTTSTNRSGRYSFAADPHVTYFVLVNKEGFAPYVSSRISVPIAKTLDIHLRILTATLQIDVSDDNAAGTDPDKNGDAIVLKGKDIDQLPLDSNELQHQLDALAGGDSPELYVNGFSGGTLPPRDSIREIRINQNPYSAQNDTNPGNGFIQIFTKPGSDKFRFALYGYGNANFLNSLNPFVTYVPPYHSYNLYSNFSGPLSKRASFFLDGGVGHGDSNSIVNAEVLDPNLNEVNFSQAVPSSESSKNISARFDTSIGAHSTFIVRYSLAHSNQTNVGVGEFSLASQSADAKTMYQALEISNSQVLSPHLVNDTRFQYTRSRAAQTPVSFAPTIVVQGAFTAGGNNSGAFNDNQDRYELQNYLSQAHEKHYLTYGARLRVRRDANDSRANYNGEYTFASLAGYQAAQQALASGASSTTGASQFSITAGNPNVAVSVADLGVFFQDDYKLRPDFTLSAGLRFETQNHISDHADWAPRLGFAWSLPSPKGRPATYVVRGGVGVFYRRFGSAYVLQAARQDGINQQQYIVNSPNTYPNIPAVSTLGTQLLSTTYQVSPSFRAPYLISSTIGLERRLGSLGSVTVTYLFNRGVHTQIERNINAPLPGTYNASNPAAAARPLGGSQNVYEYESVGIFNEDRLSLTYNLRFKKRYFLYGFLRHAYDKTDDNNGGFPSNSYDLGADYGRSSNVASDQLTLGGGLDLPFGFNSYTYLRALSGLPFNILVGQDLNGDSQFNDRPSFATDLTRPSVVKTAYGNFDTNPIAGQTIIPVNYGTGPGYVSVNMTVGRSFSFGPASKAVAGAPASSPSAGAKAHVDRRYSLNLSVDAQNLFNHPNLAVPVGTLDSPLFGRSIALATNYSNNTANRIVSVQAFFRF